MHNTQYVQHYGHCKNLWKSSALKVHPEKFKVLLVCLFLNLKMMYEFEFDIIYSRHNSYILTHGSVYCEQQNPKDK